MLDVGILDAQVTVLDVDMPALGRSTFDAQPLDTQTSTLDRLERSTSDI
jgi:hypothetical protein